MPKKGETGDDSDDESSWKWDGSADKLDEFNKRMARWCRSRWGTQYGNHFWNNTLPNVEEYKEGEWNDYCSEVWDVINDMNPAKAKGLWDIQSGFYEKSWHHKWRKAQYDRLYDKVEASVTGMAALEVDGLGMNKAPQLKAHLHKQFGGAGEDIRAREEHFEAGMPDVKGGDAFPSGVQMENKLRTLQAERIALMKLCMKDKRNSYEYGKESKLVKIVLRHLRNTEYRECVDKLLQEVKMRKEFESKLPVVNTDTGRLELPSGQKTVAISEDWDFRNFSDDWLPGWIELKSKLISHYKERQFGRSSSGTRRESHQTKRLPTMYVPGLGSRPTVRCFGCGEYGHRRGDDVCKAGPNDWHSSAPKHFQSSTSATMQRSGGNKGKGKGNQPKNDRRNVDGLKGKKRSNICFEYQKTGRCRFGPNCKFEHPKRKARHQEVYLTKRVKKAITAATVRSLKEELKERAKDDGKGSEDDSLRDYMKSVLCIRNIPREPRNPVQVQLPVFNTIKLMKMECEVCIDSGAAMGVSTSKQDFVYLDESTSARSSVSLNGPSVGTPGCGGRGVLVYRMELDEIPFGIVHPDGILAEGDRIEFRLASERIMKRQGLRVLNGCFEEADYLECVRTGKKVPLSSEADLLVMATNGVAADIVDSPEFRSIVNEIAAGRHSPLLDLRPFLNYDGKSEPKKKTPKTANESKQPGHEKKWPVCILNEAKLSTVDRSRLWCRRLGNVSSEAFPKMRSMPEYGDIPMLIDLNEDNKVGDLAKFKRKKFPKNDPEITMDCPPWWRVYCDGYGGQLSLGSESYEGAVGAYVFTCVSTGSVDIKLYASHKQFPIALHQFLARVEAEHFRCHCIYVDTHSVNLSQDAEEVCSIYCCLILPVSAGTPQEMAFAESKVRVIKQMSTSMLIGAPHLPSDSWALADKYTAFIQDFLPQSTRHNHCPYYLRTGRSVPWSLLCIHPFGAPCIFAPIEGAIHKRAPVAEEGFFCGIQWPAVLVRRKSDQKIISVSRKKVKVYEHDYIGPLSDGPSLAPSNSDPDQDLPVIRPELDTNRVQSIKSLREHTFRLPGKETRETTALEESAMQFSGQGGEEGEYVDQTVSPDPIAHLNNILSQAEDIANKIQLPTMREEILRKLMKMGKDLDTTIPKGRLKIGKKAKGDVSKDNVVTGKRIRSRRKSNPASPQLQNEKIDSGKKQKLNVTKRGRGRPPKIAVGDFVSLPSTAFDGNEKGSFSVGHPDPVYGKVEDIKENGLTTVIWEDGDRTHARLKDLKLVKKKVNAASIVVMLVEGETIAFELNNKDKFPKDFFEVLVRSDWRKWVEAIKKELTGWENNQAVSVIDISEVPANARIVPLGELFSIKRDGRYKFRQYLMGNLLREGIDYGVTFSTTISNSGTCIFFSLATTCRKEVWGWDAICGYLQCEEQHDVYAFLPSHHGYSDLEYEDIAKLRLEFLRLVQEEGEEGLRKFAKRHKRDTRKNPRQVYKCNKSIYGGPSAGHEFEMKMHAVHTKGCGLTQTQPEPSIYVRIVVNEQDVVVGYLIVAIYVDDVRFFGTERERNKYIEDVRRQLKVTIESPPVADFISIEVYQDMRTNTCELKMPRYWEKAGVAFQDLFKDGFKERLIPLTVYDEKILKQDPTPDEIAEAKDLPFLQMLGVMTYPSSNCKFEIKLAISKLGCRRNGWSKKHFEVALRVFEYGYCTRDIGIIYSKGLDPHGENIIWASADASLEVPRPYGCRIVMMNGGAISFKAKKQTMTAPSTVWAELTEFSNVTFDICGARNLLSELGFVQTEPTPVEQDNEAAQRIINNRGSAGVTSRAMDLKILSSRNRIEDHDVVTVNTGTEEILADIGTKALAASRFIRLRDLMNGYSIVKAAYPSKEMSDYVYSPPNATSLTCVRAALKKQRNEKN